MTTQFENDLVSIICPAYNAANTIAATIRSVLDQTCPRWELLIADDCSSDETVKRVARYQARDARIRLYRNAQNLGPAGSRNRLLQEARGRYIAFLDADDEWLPSKLEKQLALLRSSDAAITCTGYLRQFKDRQIKLLPPPRITYHDLLKTNHIPMLTALVDREKTGAFQFAEKGHEDYQLWLDLTRTGNACRTVPDVLAIYNAGNGSSVSGNKLKAARWHWAVMSREPIPPVSKLINFAHYMSRGLLKNI